MFNISKKLGLFALVCTFAGLAGCGSGAGTDNKKANLVVCSGQDVLKADNTCGKPDTLPACPSGQVRIPPSTVCEVSTFVPPTMPATLAADEAVIYINKADAVKDFSGYSLYTWQDCGNGWASPSNPDINGKDNWDSKTINPISSTPATADPVYGGYFIVKLKPGGTCGNFIIRAVDLNSKSGDLQLKLGTGGAFDRRYFVIEKGTSGMNSDAKTSALPICVDNKCEPYKKRPLVINDAAAHWVTPSKIVWNRNATKLELYEANNNATITATDDGKIAGGTLVAELSSDTLTDPEKDLVRHLSTFPAFSLPGSFASADELPGKVKNLLKKELVLVDATDPSAKVGTRIQNYAVLDALYTAGPNPNADESPLGAIYEGDTVTLSVWAPTAQLVELRLFSDTPTPTIDGVPGYFPSILTQAMSFDSVTGIWSISGTRAELDRKYYRYRVSAYNQITNSFNILEVVDPYSLSLSADGYHSQVVDLSDEDLLPDGWKNQVVPTVDSFESMSIYETHVRDFSALDESTPKEHRGKYLAFTDTNSAPVQHLKSLKAAGLTHIHLLPINDGSNSSVRESAGGKYNLDTLVKDLCIGVPTASVCPSVGRIDNDNANNLHTLRQVLESYAGDSDKARKLMESLRKVDSFNWGYDPQFYNTPEGSYSTNPNGVTRIIEARKMNQALHELGLRVVLDVVYPHMLSSGIESADASFDKIVPGYYFRNNIDNGGRINDTGAGADTAIEHAMMGKFLVDSVAVWAEQYKVDGFRFDQSGFIPKSVLLNAYTKVKTIDPDTYFYAEAWTASGANARSRVAELSAQEPLAGTGIGTFNDRIRDPLRNMALVKSGDPDLNAVRAGLAGNLADFKLLLKSGAIISASSLEKGKADAYNKDPQEAINYVEKHDGATLWDWMHLPNALPADTNVDNRVRIQDLTLSVPLLSQGIPFIQMGSDLLRSKSMDSNSYNSGDWFNYVDFTKQTNNWRVGLPLEHSATDEQILAAFADPESKPTSALIQRSSNVFNEFLTIGKEKLFSLQTASEVIDRVGFHDGGISQVGNLIVMSIDDGVGTVAGTSTPRPDLDPLYDAVVVVFNGTAVPVNRTIATSTGFTLHSIQQNSADSVVKTAHFTEGATVQAGGVFTVPAYTTAVFVKLQQNNTQGAGLAADVTLNAVPALPYGNTKIYLRGKFSSADDNDSKNWADRDEVELVYEGGGIYSQELELTARDIPFKIASSDWNAVNKGTRTTAPSVPMYTATTFYSNGTQPAVDNASVVIPANGIYRFRLDASNSESPVLTVTDTKDVYVGNPIYLKGTVTSWDALAENIFSYTGNGIYVLTKSNLAAGAKEFKIANADWSDPNLGSSSTVTLGAPLTLVPGSNSNVPLTIPSVGSYKFTLDANDPANPTITVIAN